MENVEEKKKNKKIWLLVILFLLLIIGAVSAFLIITKDDKTATQKTKCDTNIHFANIKEFSSSVTATKKAEIKADDKTKLTYEVTLSKPGDFYQFNVDVVNDGSNDGIVNLIKSKMNGKLISELPEYLGYSVTYNDGQEIKEKQTLNSEDTKTYTVIITYKREKDMAEGVSPGNEQVVSMELDLDVECAKENEKEEKQEKKAKLCKRADLSTLHTETCKAHEVYRSCEALHDVGDTIVYGNRSTTKGKLTSGDAFDCDVNGDGIYDSTTERFYYVSDYYDTTTKSFNDKYATLIYYNNVKAGEPSNTTGFTYGSNNESWHGPQTGYVELPSTSQWTNVKLFKETRQILNELTEATTDDGNKQLPLFTDTNKAARLLAAQELNKGCNIVVGYYNDGELDTCEYLLENTWHSDPTLSRWWLETVRFSGTAMVFEVGSPSLLVGNLHLLHTFGIRPAIDVEKSNILY